MISPDRAGLYDQKIAYVHLIGQMKLCILSKVNENL